MIVAQATPSPSPPPPPATYVSAEDELSPGYYSEAGSSNQVNLRAQIPYGDSSTYYVRIKLPIVTSAPPEAITGAGDLAVTNFAIFNPARPAWVGGLTFRFPTANDSLGTHKYSLGPALGYTVNLGRWTLGLSEESYFSVIGPSSYPSVGKSQLSPTLRLALYNGWSIGFSTMQFTYDWVINRWTDVPFGLRLEKHGIAGLASLDAYADAERNLVHTAETPGWTIRSAVRWYFTRFP